MPIPFCIFITLHREGYFIAEVFLTSTYSTYGAGYDIHSAITDLETRLYYTYDYCKSFIEDTVVDKNGKLINLREKFLPAWEILKPLYENDVRNES